MVPETIAQERERECERSRRTVCRVGLRVVMKSITGSAKLLSGLTVLLLASPPMGAWATETDMAVLPLYEPFRCLTCHVSESPTSGDTALNVFGLDFLDNGRVWDLQLANSDSDGDGCTNGIEIGDSDGDGQLDGNVEEQEGNPGVDDNCGSGSQIDERKWGALKAMFDGR